MASYMLLTEKVGKRRGIRRNLLKGEIVERIPGKSTILFEGCAEDNFRVISDPDISLCVQRFNEIIQLERNEAEYLRAIEDPGVRIVEYENKIRMNEMLDLRVNDVVIVNLTDKHSDTVSLPVHGRIEYIGSMRNRKGTLFGINIALVSIDNMH